MSKIYCNVVFILFLLSSLTESKERYFANISASAVIQQTQDTLVIQIPATLQQGNPDSTILLLQTPVSADSTQPADTSAQSTSIEETVEDAQNEIDQIRELISFSKIIYTLVILFLTYFMNKYLSIILDNISEKVTNYRLFIKRLAPISRIFIWSFAIYIIIAAIIAPPFQTIVAIGASVGIAVGFASQDILKNIFGGIMIILDKPFQVGDKISIGEHYGEVLSIGLRSCRVVTPDDSVVSIPNAEIMNRAVSNTNSSALDCQVVAEIYLPATVNISAVKRISMKAVYASPFTYLNKPVDIIVLNEMKDRQYIVKLRVKAYVLDIRYEFLFKSDMTEMILEECNRMGYIPVSFQQSDKN